MKYLTPIILVALAAGLFFWYIDPAYARVKDLRAEAAQFDEALSRSEELLAVRDALLSRYNSFSTDDIRRLERLLPDHVDNVRLIVELDALAARYGLSLDDISVGEADDADAAPGRTAAGGSDEIGKVFLNFSVTAPYETFLKFLMDLEDSVRLLDVSSVSFTAEDDDLSTYSVAAAIYWLK